MGAAMLPRDLGETLRMALAALARSPLRSGLTILGLAIGVGAYIAMTSFGQGAKRAVVSQFAALGVNVIRVQSLVGDPALGKPARPLTQLDVDSLHTTLTGAARVVPNAHVRLPASARGASVYTTIVGTTPDYFAVRDWRPAFGGNFDANDMAQRGKVCVLGVTPATAIFGNSDPIGATMALGDALTCNVIGVLAPKGLNTSGKDLDDLIVVPSTTYEAYIGLPNGFAEIEVEASSPALIGLTRAETAYVIRRNHRTPDYDPDDFRVTSPSEAIRAATNVSTILSRLLATIAAVSLLVGGIGIMNIQLVSVAERTREIGIRSALGASPSQILVQFLAEAVVLSTTGALVGVITGTASAWAVGRAMHWVHAIDVTGVATAAAFGVGAGVIFGYAPARRAAQLDPIDALRHE
jgi:putative ABC transport system permease protein